MSFALQAQADLIDQVFESLKTQDIETLETFLQEEVILEVLDDEDIFTKAEAVEKIKAFLTENNASTVSLKHQGDSGNGTSFAIGSLETADGNMRIYFVVEEGKVSELCFQEND